MHRSFWFNNNQCGFNNNQEQWNSGIKFEIRQKKHRKNGIVSLIFFIADSHIAHKNINDNRQVL